MFEPKPVNYIPDVIIKDEVYSKINSYTELCNDEISALGSVIIRDNKIVVDDIFLFEQTVSSASTVLSPKDISQFMCEYIKNGKDTSTLKFWWHSHVRMGTFWSGTDIDTINRFSSDWMISMVSNKMGDSKIRLDMFNPFRISIDNIPLRVEYARTFNPDVKAEIDAKVRPVYYPFLPELRRCLTSHSSLAYPNDTKTVLSNDHPMMRAPAVGTITNVEIDRYDERIPLGKVRRSPSGGIREISIPDDSSAPSRKGFVSKDHLSPMEKTEFPQVSELDIPAPVSNPVQRNWFMEMLLGHR